MATWSGMRKKLEREYLAESLRGHIQYYATSYRKSPDHEGRAAIRYDGKEIIKGCYYFLSLEIEHPRCMTVAQFLENEGVEE